MNEDIPHRLQPHYCRECGRPFPTTEGEGSPHAQVWKHRYIDHRQKQSTYTSCSRNCLDRQQHAEAISGQRLYGKGLARPAPSEMAIELLQQLFPED